MQSSYTTITKTHDMPQKVSVGLLAPGDVILDDLAYGVEVHGLESTGRWLEDGAELVLVRCQRGAFMRAADHRVLILPISREDLGA